MNTWVMRHEETLRKYKDNPKHCLKCGIELEYKSRKNKFCSHSCAAKIGNKSQARIRTRNCKQCGNETKNASFCSNKCFADWRVSTRNWDDLRRDSSRREHLILENGRVCSSCGMSNWFGLPMPVELDHIDGNPENNSKENCRLICPNCHTFTDTYKGRNAGRVTNSKRKNTMSKTIGKYR